MTSNLHIADCASSGVLNGPNYQDSLFYESANDAIGTCIQAAGGFKRVACLIWPALKPESAYARLKACLDDSKAEKLTPDEIIGIAKLARERGCHAWMQFCATEIGYATPIPVEPEDERAALQREYIAAVNRLDAISRRLAR